MIGLNKKTIKGKSYFMKYLVGKREFILGIATYIFNAIFGISSIRD